MILDSNVVFELLDCEPESSFFRNVERLRSGYRTCINEIIFAEICPRFLQLDLALEVCETFRLDIEPLALDECHRAGHAFAEYRRRGGAREVILPDFLIGAQAACRGWPIVTRDRKGFASYFPGLEIIDPLEGMS